MYHALIAGRSLYCGANQAADAIRLTQARVSAP